MKLASSILLILYGGMMLFPLFHKQTPKIGKILLFFAEVFFIIHISLYFTNHMILSCLTISLLLFQLMAIYNGIISKKFHWSHQIIRFMIHMMILLLFILNYK